MCELAKHLGVSEERVRRDIGQGVILAVRKDLGGELRIPRAQLEGKGLMTGLGEVLGAMHVRDPWMRLQLLLDQDVIGPLRAGRIEEAVRAVRSYLPRDEGQRGR